jgi:sucrose-6-phosphatase
MQQVFWKRWITMTFSPKTVASMPERLLVCTDLDRTLIPNGVQPESASARRHFAQLAQQPQIMLAYVSGRHRELVQYAIDEYELPQPQYIIGDVGTTIYTVNANGQWSLLEAWESSLDRDWQHLSREELSRTLAGMDALQLQEPEKQNRHKLSFYVPPPVDQEQLKTAVSEALGAKGISARQVWSIDDIAGVILLDIVPLQAGKYHAIKALQALAGFSDANTVFSGDSGNDMEVLASPVPSTLVANSSPQLQQQATEMSAAAGNSNCLYIACGDFRGMNGNYSAGILEGIAHYHPEILAWMGFEGTE